MTVENDVLDDLVDYIIRLEAKFSKSELLRDVHRHFIYAIMLIWQFNGTKNDTNYSFKKIIESLNRVVDKKVKESE